MQCSTLALLGLPPTLLMVASIVSPAPRNPAIKPALEIGHSLDLPDRVQGFLRRSCYDCHSNQTRWPFYAGLPVVSRLIQKDVHDGRSLVNFSEWAATAGVTPGDAAIVLDETCEVLRRGSMPMPKYLYLHPEARPSPAEINMYCTWAGQQSARLRAAHQSSTSHPDERNQ